MSAGVSGQRVAVFAVFAVLCGAVGAAFAPGVPGSVPSIADLEGLESKMFAGARLHTLPAVPAPIGPARWCAECHPAPPHSGGGVQRAMLNEHAGRMDCLLCHWSAPGGSRPAPAWQVQAGSTAFLSVQPRESASDDQLASMRAAVTVGRACFARGPACTGCHRPGGIGALARPGSTQARTETLERLDHYFTLAAGEKWYFPRIQ